MAARIKCFIILFVLVPAIMLSGACSAQVPGQAESDKSPAEELNAYYIFIACEVFPAVSEFNNQRGMTSMDYSDKNFDYLIAEYGKAAQKIGEYKGQTFSDANEYLLKYCNGRAGALEKLKAGSGITEEDFMNDYNSWLECIKSFERDNSLAEYVPAVTVVIEPAYISSFINVTQDAANAVTRANASVLATSINAYNALNPEDIIPDNVSFEEVKSLLTGINFWPVGMDDVSAKEAWELVVIKDGEASVNEAAQSGANERTADDDRENAAKIAAAVNLVNQYNNSFMEKLDGLPEATSKELNDEAYKSIVIWWPVDVIEEDAALAALKYLDYDGNGTAGVKD